MPPGRRRPAVPRSRAGRAATVLAAAGATALGVAVAAGPAAATSSTGVVINEVYGGGGNSGAVLTNDFIELYNSGTTAVNLAGWSVQYKSATSTAAFSGVTSLTGSIAPGKTFLIQEASGGSTGAALPVTPDVTGSVNLSATAGVVALVNGTTALNCSTDAACVAAGAQDLVGFGSTANISETAPAPAPSNTTSITRTSGADTDSNSADFTVANPPTPTTGTTTGGGGATPGPLRIHDIQGDSFVSPHAGDTVTNVPGIVTATRTYGSSKGYWIQDPTPDDDPATSEGIFVYTGSTPTVAVGDSVLVSGKVADYYQLASGESTSSTSQLSVTEIDQAGTPAVVSSGNPLPAPIVLTPTTVPDTYAPDLGGGNIENTPIDPARSALDYYESIEGMLVEIDNARVVGPSAVFGSGSSADAEQYITTKPGQDATYRGGTELLGENQTPSGRLELVTSGAANPDVNVGDVLKGAWTGTIDYSEFGGYTIADSTQGTVQHNNLAPVVATAPAKGQLSVATYNVENLAPTDPDSKFAALGKGVVTNLASPDIVAVEEIQDNDGASDDGVVDATQTLTKLTQAITAAGGPSYQWQGINPVNDQDGGQPGGNIRTVFLYNPKAVSFVSAGGSNVNRSTTGTEVKAPLGGILGGGVGGLLGGPSLTLSPGRIDPTNPVWNSSRKPLVGEFKFNGKKVFVIANHFDAKLGDQNADGRFQYPAQSSATQRAGQALVEHNFVQELLNADNNADVVVVGDLNDYQFSPALNVLKTGKAAGTAKPILTDLITTLPTDQQYTYDYDGISEVLDHILVTKHLSKVNYQVVHVNSEYADQVSDHDPQVVDVTP